VRGAMRADAPREYCTRDPLIRTFYSALVGHTRPKAAESGGGHREFWVMVWITTTSAKTRSNTMTTKANSALAELAEKGARTRIYCGK
jgi:hypothetical protein